MASSATDVGMSGSQEIKIRPEYVQTVNLHIGIFLKKRIGKMNYYKRLGIMKRAEYPTTFMQLIGHFRAMNLKNIARGYVWKNK
jgi:hypothetical protein